MDNNILSSTRVYTDIQSLDQVKYENSKDQGAAKKEVAQQFEAILMQMVMTSMRDANKAFAPSDDVFSNDQMDMYQDMFDKQLSLMMSNAHLGFADIIEKNMDQQQATSPTSPVSIPVTQTQVTGTTEPFVTANLTVSDAHSQSTQQPPFKTPEDFVKKLWASSKQAASALGLSPELLLAQAALETNWGKSVIAQNQTNSSHNLFNIKADPSWTDKTVSVDALEQMDGVLVKQKSAFRSYDSFQASFQDYVNFLKTNDKYSEALSKTSNPDQYMSSLQKAGYATDQNYADKVMKIYNSPMFQRVVTKVKEST